MKAPNLPVLGVLVATCLTVGAPAAIVSGVAARSQFESMHALNGGTFEDFEAYKGQLLTTQLPGLTMATTLQRYPSVATVSLAVAVLPYGFLQAPSGFLAPLRSGNVPDGQSRWEITFDTPQRWTGLVRYFNTNSLTSFYAGSTLLGTHQNAANSEFVGYVAESADPGTWVTRIVMDGNNAGGSYQVGYGDDLFYGTVVPEPSVVLLAALGLAAFGRRRR